MQITCPYCFGKFEDNQVHFRRVTFDDKKEIGESERHIKFWKERGFANDKNSIPPEFIPSNWDKEYNPWDIPVEENPQDFERDKSGFCESAKERDTGMKMTQRLCPHCHNPLPQNYGKYETKFISVIGVTGAGKTVYISQMLYRMVKAFAQVGFAVAPDSITYNAYIAKNKVLNGQPLPEGTGPKILVPPMTFQMTSFNAAQNRQTAKTFVIYDIAGEMFDSQQNNQQMLTNGFRFISQSDAVIMLIDPAQVGINDGRNDNGNQEDTVQVITAALNGLLQQIDNNKKRDNGLLDIPVAVCLSKGDKAYGAVNNGEIFMDCVPSPIDGCFNAADYNNSIQGCLQSYFENAVVLKAALKAMCGNYNYFMVSAIGHNRISKINGISILDANPIPLRIMEPLMWIFVQLGYMQSDGEINSPCETVQAQRISWWRKLINFLTGKKS